MTTRSLALFAPLLLAVPAFADKDDDIKVPDNLPAQLVAPQGEELSFAALGVGYQIYDCKAAGLGYAWVFRAPSATLYEGDGDKDDDVLGTHCVGPTWGNDHGTVVGSVAARVAAPDPADIPWLRLTAVSHTGTGRFSKVTTIQRLNTSGGIAPAGGCDATTVGAEADVPYTASYFFYRLPGKHD
jgi:hypothetical protein